MRLSRLVLTLAIVVLVSACGGSSNGDSTPAAQQPSKTASSNTAPSTGGSDKVTIQNFKFGPASLTVKAGAKVTVTNSDSTTHTATADGGAFDTGDVDPGVSKTITLSKAGTYPYHCTIHSFMKGTIVVS
jgi:plastocyanin